MIKAFAVPPLVALSASIALGQTNAQEMRPLADLVESAAPPYPTARCGALYQAMMEWTGSERMGPEMWQSTNTMRENMILASAVVAAAATGVSVDSQVTTTLRDVRNIADLYIERMERNYAVSGQPFFSDQLITEDLDLCRRIVENLHGQ